MKRRDGRRHMVAAGVAACLLGGAATSADATQIWYGTFNGAYGGATVENVGGPGQEVGGDFSVIWSGNTNLYKSGDGGVDCGAGFTSCMSLEASDLSSGTIRSLDASNPGSDFLFHVLAGDTVTVSFELSGNQRSADPASTDRFMAGVFYGQPMDLGVVTRAGAWTDLTPIDPNFAANIAFASRIAAGKGFQTYSLTFVAPEDMNFAFEISGLGPVGASSTFDGLGPILRSVAVDVVSPGGVPEPATWALMLLGFGGLGTALRRRRAFAAS